MHALDPQFDAFAADYDATLNRGLAISGEDMQFFARERLRWLRRCLDRARCRPRHVMDFGCGTGSATPLLFEFWPGIRSMVGTDVSVRSLAAAAASHGSDRARFAVAMDLTPEGRYDLVYCNGVFHHIHPVERGEWLRYIHDSLRPGGMFAFFENNPWNPGARWVMRRIPFDRDAIMLSMPESRRVLRQSGFEVVRSDSLFYFPRHLRWLRPLEFLGARLPFGAQYLILCRKPLAAPGRTTRSIEAEAALQG
jgi:SAM-dependent methyltransferase